MRPQQDTFALNSCTDCVLWSAAGRGVGEGSPGVGEPQLHDWALERADADGEFQMKLPRKRRRRSKHTFSHVFPPCPSLGAGWYTCLGHLTPPLGN